MTNAVIDTATSTATHAERARIFKSLYEAAKSVYYDAADDKREKLALTVMIHMCCGWIDNRDLADGKHVHFCNCVDCYPQQVSK